MSEEEPKEEIEIRKCPHCGSHRVVISGSGWRNKVRYACKNCWHTFYL